MISAKNAWLWALLIGTFLFGLEAVTVHVTSNHNFVPTTILIGAFTVPVSFAFFVYGQERSLDRVSHRRAPLLETFLCFLVGGAVGTVFAGLIEYFALGAMPAYRQLGVGLIEESVKLILPLGLYLSGRFRSGMDGLVFGVASGMGFAAMETMGYGLVMFLNTERMSEVLETLMLRSFAAPVAHAAWTGVVCATIWRARLVRTAAARLDIVLAVFAATVLHAFWNIFNYSGFMLQVAAPVVIGGISLLLLAYRFLEARGAGADPGGDT